MSRANALRARAEGDLHLRHLTDGPTFLEAVLDAPMMLAFDSDATLMKSYAFLGGDSLRVLQARRDRDTEAAKALMQIAADYREGKAQSKSEAALGKWLSHLIDASVQRMIDRADDAGTFLRRARETA